MSDDRPDLRSSLLERITAPEAPFLSRPHAKAATDLEWWALLEALSGCCQSALGEALAARLPALDGPDAVERRLDEVAEASELIGRRLAPGLAGLSDIAAELERAARDGVLDGDELRRVGAVARLGEEAREALQSLAELAPLLSQWGAALRSTGWLAAIVDGAIDVDGQIKDSASADLGALRSRAHKLDRNLHGHVEKLLNAPELTPFLQDRFFTLRDGRYVFPVKASEQSEVPGIVHGRSGSGQTFFIEPAALVDYNNRLKMAQIAVEQEELRILSELSTEVAAAAPDLSHNLRRLAYLDVTCAAGRLAQRLRAERQQLTDTSIIDLRQARHPLLALREQASEGAFRVIPNDIAFGAALGGEAGSVLVISGPNTGGKTVTLKTLGLFALMTRAGLLLPAEAGSRLPLFGSVFADIGDDQSLSENLSSFSGHLTYINDFFPISNDSSLVLLDELFAGTDPVQGGALSVALLEELAQRGALVGVTTHSQPLKQYALARPGFRSASMGFDLTNLEPNYELSLGTPGSSHALEIARKMGLDESLLNRAASLLQGDGDTQLEATLSRLETQRQRLADTERELKLAKSEAEREQRRFTKKFDDLREAALEDIDERLSGLSKQIRETELLVKRHRRSLNPAQGNSPPRTETLDAMAQDLRAARTEIGELRDGRERHQIAEERRPLDVASARLGQAVWVRPLKGIGELVQIDLERQEARVQMGLLKSVVGLADLYDVSAAEEHDRRTTAPRHDPKAPPPPTQLGEEDPPPPQHPGNTADLRGMRVDEAIDALERYLDDAYSRREPALYVIHGHGTGALKRAVRDHLRDSVYARRYQPAARAQGGDGVTLVELG